MQCIENTKNHTEYFSQIFSHGSLFFEEYPPVISSISPATGYGNTTVAFTLTGNYFEPGGTTVKFLSQTTGATGSVNVLNPAILSIAPTQIVGSVTIPYAATMGLWKIKVATVDGGSSLDANAFRVA